MKTVLAIAGSLRRHSFNRLLLDAAAQLAPEDMKVVRFEGLASIPLFDEDLEGLPAGNPEPVERLRRAVASADGLLIATPEYNWSIPGVLKNAIDWLSRAAPDEPLAGKPVAVMGASIGGWGTRLAQAALRQVLAATESVVLPSPALFVRNASGAFDESGTLTDAVLRGHLGELLAAFNVWIDKTSPGGLPSVPPNRELHV